MSDVSSLLSEITSSALSAQGTTAQILLDENQRLINKEKSITDAKFGQQRIIDLNRSYSKKNAAYTRVMLFAALSLGIILLLRLFGSTFIHESIFALIYILLISATVLYGIYTYADVNARESTNFDRLNIPPPVITMSEADKKNALENAKKKGDLMALGSGTCAGQACCDYNQAYNITSNKCDTKCNDDANGSGYFSTKTNACAVCATGKPFFDKTTKECTACASGSWKLVNGVYGCAP
jgi:hypothetical protein